MQTRAGILWAAATALIAASAAHAVRPAMTAEGLVLIVNRQQPAGRALAERYAELRHVPADRIIEIDVPDEVELTPEAYEKSIAEPVRHELEARQLREKTQCLVTFYGVPLRVKDREVTPFEQNEVKAILDPSVNALRAQFKKSVEAVEAVASVLDANFKPDTGATNTEQLRLRGVAAESAVRAKLAGADPAKHDALEQQFNAARAGLTQMPPMPAAPSTRPAPVTQAEVNEWLAKPNDPEARRKLREALYAAGNVYQMLVVVEAQQRALQGGEGEASVDSELSCLWLKDYPRQKWVPNPWHAAASPQVVDQLRPLVVRVSRIDGPTPEIAKRVFEEAVATEERGLSGDVVIDARGMTGSGPPMSYDGADQAIRNVAKYVSGPDLKPVFDNNPGLLPDHSSKEAAIYCGWYSVRKYQPTAKFVPGSIAWHVASYEMVTLRSPMETGWCRGLMLDGADVTLGPVGEPYLLAFPPADEFLSLVMTGTPTIAEAYWATVPVTSWKMVLIADPLYRPFAKRPVVESTQLTPPLAKWLAD